MKRKSTVACFLSLALAATSCAAEPAKLFNGKDLDGWHCHLVDPGKKLADVWSVRDGLLVCRGEPMGYLATDKKFRSFRLVVEWRWAPGTKPGNSGVLLRIDGEPKALPSCYEAQLQHGKAGDIYGFHGLPLKGDEARMIRKPGHELAGDLTGVSKTKDAEKPAGEWNRYEITLDGGKLTLSINGEKVNEAAGLAVRDGKIAVQSEGGEIHFRTIELTPLPAAP
jgi:hypothetical protein